MNRLIVFGMAVLFLTVISVFASAQVGHSWEEMDINKCGTGNEPCIEQGDLAANAAGKSELDEISVLNVIKGFETFIDADKLDGHSSGYFCKGDGEDCPEPSLNCVTRSGEGPCVDWDNGVLDGTTAVNMGRGMPNCPSGYVFTGIKELEITGTYCRNKVQMRVEVNCCKVVY